MKSTVVGLSQKKLIKRRNLIMKKNVSYIIVFSISCFSSYAQLSTTLMELKHETEVEYGYTSPSIMRIDTIKNVSGPVKVRFKLPKGDFDYPGNNHANLLIITNKNAQSLNYDIFWYDSTYTTPFAFRAYINPPDSILFPAGIYNDTLVIEEVNNIGNTVRIPLQLKLAKNVKVEREYISGYPQKFYLSSTGKIDSCDVASFKPVGNFVPPAIGGSYIDEHYGAKVTVISDTGYFNPYPTPSSISHANKYVLLGGPNFNSIPNALVTPSGMNVKNDVFYTNTGFAPDITGNTDVWDAYNDSIMYGFRGVKLYRLNVLSGLAVLMTDYGLPPYNFTQISTGGTGDATKDNFYGFTAPQQKKICVIDFSKNFTYVRNILLDVNKLDSVNGGLFNVDHFAVSRGWDKVSGKRYVVAMCNPAITVYSIDTLNSKLDFEYRGPESFNSNIILGKINGSQANYDGICDPGEACYGGGDHKVLSEDASGNQYIIGRLDISSNVYTSIKAASLLRSGNDLYKPYYAGGGQKIISAGKGGGNPVPQYGGLYSATDYYASSARNAPVYIETNASFGRPYSDLSSFVLEGVTGNVTMTVLFEDKFVIRPLVKTRNIGWSSSGAGNYDYWNLSRTCISPDGKLAVFSSNFGYPGNTTLGWGGATSIRGVAIETQLDDIFSGITSIKNTHDRIDFNVGPIPASSTINVTFGQVTNFQSSIQLCDVLGRVVFADNITTNNKYSINVTNVEPGVYFITLSNNTSSLTKKIIIAH